MDIGIEAEIDLDELMGQIVRSVDPSSVIDSMLDHLLGYHDLTGARSKDEALCRRLISQINTRLKEEYPPPYVAAGAAEEEEEDDDDDDDE